MLSYLKISETDACTFVAVTYGTAEVPPLVRQYFALRARVFIEEMGWEDLASLGQDELDEYDTSRSVYILAVDKRDDRVIGGVRLNPTDQSFFYSQFSTDATTYMLLDAYRGHLPNIPSTICSSEPPVSPTVAEASRLVCSTHRLYRDLLAAGIEYLRGSQYESCLFLTHPTFLHVGKRMGLDVVPLGPVIGTEKDAIQSFRYRIESENDDHRSQ